MSKLTPARMREALLDLLVLVPPDRLELMRESTKAVLDTMVAGEGKGRVTNTKLDQRLKVNREANR